MRAAEFVTCVIVMDGIYFWPCMWGCFLLLVMIADMCTIMAKVPYGMQMRCAGTFNIAYLLVVELYAGRFH